MVTNISEIRSNQIPYQVNYPLSKASGIAVALFQICSRQNGRKIALVILLPYLAYFMKAPCIFYILLRSFFNSARLCIILSAGNQIIF